MKKLIVLMTALLSLSSCAPVGVLSESAYTESITIDPNLNGASISYDVNPKELHMY